MFNSGAERQPEPIAPTLLVLGLGLIGGSLAQAARQRGVFREVVGTSRSPDTLAQALAMGVVDRVEADTEKALRALRPGDVMVIGVPTLTVPEILKLTHKYLAPGVAVTDVASVKGSVVRAAREIYGAIPEDFVPGHPIAGSEKSGVAASQPQLFDNHQVILTPLAETAAGALRLVETMWRAVGARVFTMPVEEHDEVLAATSHLPHLLAYSLVDTLAGMEDNREIFSYAAGGFRDFTRIAASDPVMWHDITVANRDAILAVCDRFEQGLQQLRSAVEQGHRDKILGVYTRASEARRHFQLMLEKRTYLQVIDSEVIDYRVQPGGKLNGRARVPGDKSISHRAIMLGSIAEGVTEVRGFLEGEDSLATLQAFRDMGVLIEGPDHGRVVIHGVGLNGLTAPPGELYLGNSGTSMRLLCGLLAGEQFDTRLCGDESLSRRPMRRVVDPLTTMGARIDTDEGGTPPLLIRGAQALHGIEYSLPMASAQVKSCVLLAGLYAEGETAVIEPAPTRDHTERMLRGFSYPVETDGSRVSLRGGGALKACSIEVPADISSAAFFMVAASIAPGSDITLEHVGINPTRIGVINILQLMGADITLSNEQIVGGEPIADIRVRAATLRGIEIPADQVPLAIDEFPVLFVAAACAEGKTVLRGAEELRVKESDRIQAMADGLTVLGVSAAPTDDGIVIEGGRLGGGQVDSLGDHRIAMAFAVAGLRAEGEVYIRNCNNVATSFPGFVALAKRLGMDIVEGQV